MHPQTIGPADLPCVRILIIDNDPDDMEVYQISLSTDFEVDIAHSVDQAASLAEGDNLQKYDLIVLDIMMPVRKLFDIHKSQRGLITGLLFFDEYFNQKPRSYPISVIYLTAAPSELLPAIYEHQKLHSDQVLRVCRKRNTDPADLRDLIRIWAATRNTNRA
jgi:CheY-like chemotaxis protein